MYTFKATINRVMPNGIVNITFDLGFHEKYTSNCMLHNIAILGDKEEKVGQYLREMLPVGSLVYVNSVKLDQHGRPIVKIFTFFDNGMVDKISVNDYLIMENLSW
jgi:hypothetical protein